MQITSEQIHAARALLRLEQSDLAERAHVPLAAVCEAEAPDGMERVDAATLEGVRAALVGAGVEFIPDGVRKLPPLTPEQQALFEELEAISKASAERLKGHVLLTDDDMYDENGLPA